MFHYDCTHKTQNEYFIHLGKVFHSSYSFSLRIGGVSVGSFELNEVTADRLILPREKFWCDLHFQQR